MTTNDVMRIEVTDDSGFLALVDPDAYDNWDKAQPPEFVIELEASADVEAVWPEVPWADDQR